jgi:uncharacterized protein YkwD
MKSLHAGWGRWLRLGSVAAGGMVLAGTLFLSVPEGWAGEEGRKPADAAGMESGVLQRLNQIRRDKGHGALRGDERLANIAREYSRRMAAGGFFSHVSPDGDNLVDRLQTARISYAMAGENLFMCTNVSDPVERAVQSWMNSPGHRRNILNGEYTHTGIGVWKQGNTLHFTQVFLRPGQ